MGCEPSQVTRVGHEIKISIVDSTFMKAENQDIRNQMHAQNIMFEYFISQECFFQQFAKRYYNRVVTNLEGYPELKSKLKKMGLTPNVFVILDGRKFEEEAVFNVTTVENYRGLIQYLREHACPTIIPNSLSAIKCTKRKVNVKILCKPGVRNSQQTIFESALKKSNISFEFFNSFQLLEQSILESQSQFVVTDYVFHRQVVELLVNTKSRVICFCTFDRNQTYHSGLYSLSNNYLDITADIKYELRSDQKNTVKCSKVYLYNHGLGEDEEIKAVLEQFDIEVRQFTNIEKVIKQTTYFFCVTVICADSEAKNLAKFFERNDYLQRVKILGIPKATQISTKGLFKLIRNIKKGYKVKKSITNSIDIIDKHYNNTKFEEIKKQLESNDIKCFGFSNLSQYIKNKKFISPFIICNYEQRSLLIKYMKQLQSKAKLIVFCNKNKINHEVKDNKSFSFVSSHFGKIIKFIKKTHVFIPLIDKEDELLFKQKIDKIKTKNKRISALKWSRIEDNQSQETNQDNFQFLNIAKDTNQGSIRDIQKTIATIWKVDCSILDIENFKKQYINSLGELKKIHKINFEETQFNQMIDKLKGTTISQLLEKAKSFFDADNQLGLEINKSLMKTECLQKKQITNMREFLLLVFFNFFSAYQIPRVGKKKLCHWISNSLIEKCQIQSYIFSKHFVIFYEQSASKLNQIGKFKLQLNLEYNSLVESELMLNSFISYKDKIIFSPFSQFQVQRIVDTGEYKIVTVKYVKNIDFLKYIYQDNLFKQGQSMSQFVTMIEKSDTPFLDSISKQKVLSNINRMKAIEMFQKGTVTEAIEIHKKLIKQNEQKQNLDSALIDELNFELSCFYFKANMNREAGVAIKELLEADPGEYIKAQCQKMIKEVLEIDQINQKAEQKQKKRRISQQAMKTFVWLKNKQERSEDSFGSEDQESNQDQGVVFDNELKCMQIEDIDPIQEDYSRKNLGKQNVHD